MNTLFFTLFLVSIILLIVGLIKPSLFKNKKTGEVPTRKKVAIGCSIMIVVFLVLFSITIPETTSNNAMSENATPEKTQNNESPDDTTSRYLPGLHAKDIYQNMKKQGFKIELIKTKDFDGYAYFCKLSQGGINYEVSLASFSNKESEVETVRGTVLIEAAANKNIITSKWLFDYLVTIPFTGNDPEKVKAWLDANFDKDGQSLVVSGVKFTIFAKTPFMRMLTIEKAE